MKIYAVGDSFTAGSELVDEKYYRDFPGYSTPEENNDPKNPYRQWHRNKEYLHRLLGGVGSDAWNTAINEQKDLTYANQLGKMLDMTVINHGEGGCSMQTIRRNLFLYVSEITEPHTVFLQPTGPTRYCQYQKGLNRGYWRDFIAGYPYDNTSEDLDTYNRFKVMQEDDYSWHLEWWINFVSCVNLIKMCPWVQHFYVLDSGIVRYTHKRVTESPQDFLRDNIGDKILNTLNQLYDQGVFKKFRHATDERIMCPGGHYNHVLHLRLAQELAQIIK